MAGGTYQPSAQRVPSRLKVYVSLMHRMRCDLGAHVRSCAAAQISMHEATGGKQEEEVAKLLHQVAEEHKITVRFVPLLHLL